MALATQKRLLLYLGEIYENQREPKKHKFSASDAKAFFCSQARAGIFFGGRGAVYTFFPAQSCLAISAIADLV
jgi:hypothetical protein